MKKNLFTLSALCLATLSLIFSGCKKENNDPQEPAKVQTYKMSIQASKSADSQANGPRRVLSLDGNTLNATWAENDAVTVYNETKGAALEGTLKAETAGASVQFSGEVSGEVEAGDKLTLKFLAPSYADQKGTLAYISANCDYAIATDVEVTGIVDETIYTDGETTFENQQAVVEFNLKDNSNNAAISASELVVKVGTATYTVKPDAAASKLYVAIPGFAGETVTLTATVGSDTYTYEKTGVTFANGKFYQITAKMTKQAKEYGPFSVSSIQKVNFAQGNLKYTKSTGKFEFMTNQYDMVETKNQNVGDDYASQDVISLFGWATSNINEPANTYYQPWNTNTIYVSSYGSGITSGNVNWATAHANYDWGKNMGDGWRTLTTAEWQYLFNTRPNASNLRTWATVNEVPGMILMPDGWTANGVSLTIGTGFGTNDINTTNLATLEGQGCVFLPAAGGRNGSSVNSVDELGLYWSSTAYDETMAYMVFFHGGGVIPANRNIRCLGYSVRLVKNAN